MYTLRQYSLISSVTALIFIFLSLFFSRWVNNMAISVYYTVNAHTIRPNLCWTKKKLIKKGNEKRYYIVCMKTECDLPNFRIEFMMKLKRFNELLHDFYWAITIMHQTVPVLWVLYIFAFQLCTYTKKNRFYLLHKWFIGWEYFFEYNSMEI